MASGSTLVHRTPGNRLVQRESRHQGELENQESGRVFECFSYLFSYSRYTASAQQQGSDILEATTHHIKASKIDQLIVAESNLIRKG